MNHIKFTYKTDQTIVEFSQLNLHFLCFCFEDIVVAAVYGFYFDYFFLLRFFSDSLFFIEPTIAFLWFHQQIEI